MRKLLTVLFSVLFFNAAFSQINYQKTYPQALERSQKEKKLLFVMVAPPSLVNIPANKNGLSDDEVVKFYNKNFVNFTTTVSDTASLRLLKKFQIGSTYPCYLFIDNNENLVYKSTGFSPLGAQYLRIGNEALDRITSGKTVSAYEEKYKAGNTDAQFIKDYITLKQEIGLYDNAKLIDKYVDYLKIGDLNDYQTVRFILAAGPFAYGKAFGLAYANKKLTDSLYKYEPLQFRISINNRIINNTRAEAIATKNADLAQKVSNFTLSTWSNDRRRGYREAESEMLYYYKAIKDTANYFKRASGYYDSYYMHITPDSAEKMLDAQNQAIAKAGARGINSIIKIDTTKATKVVFARLVGTGSAEDPVAIALNNGAWDFYSTGTKNPNNLIKAMLWSKRAIALSPDSYGFYDTYAHLLYRLLLFADAKSNEATAIKLAKDNNMPDVQVDKLQGELKKMKNKTL